MTKKTKRILFFILLILFLLTAPSVVFYSWGYRFDLEAKKITQTGAFYFKVWPKNSQIYLDGKLAKKTDVFFGAAYLNNLLPKKYQVEIKKDGYYSWKKALEIKEKQVTDAKSVILISANPRFSVLSKNVQNFFGSPDGKKLLLIETDEQEWSAKLLELEGNTKSFLAEKQNFSSNFNVELVHLNFSTDSKQIFLVAKIAQNLQYFTINLEETPPTLIKIEPPLTATDTSETMFDLANANETETSTSRQGQQNIYYIDKEKFLYLFNAETNIFEKIFEGTQGVKLSLDARKIVYFSNSELWVMFLKEKLGQPMKPAGEKLLIARFSEEIGNAFWLNNHYLIFNSGSKIKVAEIDDRDSINIVDLAEFNQPKIFFSEVNSKLYILSQGNLYVSEKAMP